MSTEITETQTPETPAVEATPVRWTVPAVDVLEKDRDYKLVVDLPGVSSDDLELTVERGKLSLVATRADRPGVGYRRWFRLPQYVDGDALDAQLADGVLHVTLPAMAAHKPRRIAVR